MKLLTEVREILTAMAARYRATARALRTNAPTRGEDPVLADKLAEVYDLVATELIEQVLYKNETEALDRPGHLRRPTRKRA